jgi:hypothetical protein
MCTNYRIFILLITMSYILKFILAILSSQNDLLVIARASFYITQGQWNIYDYMSRPEIYAKDVVPGHPPAPYPYSAYLFTAAWLELLRLIGLITYEGWTAVWALPAPNWWFFLLKLPYLAADIAIGGLLARLLTPRKGLIAWALWSWSASAAYLLFMGQNDLYPTLFIALAAYLGSRSIAVQRLGETQRRADVFSIGSMLALGVGATFKVFPLFLAPLFAVLLAPRWRGRALLFAIPTAVFAVSALPFLSTPAFVSGVLFNFEGIRFFSAAQVFATPVSLFLVAYAVLFLLLIARPRSLTRPMDFWLAGAAVFSSLFLFSWSQFYWAVWLTPFVVALVAQGVGRYRYWLALWLVIEVTFAVLLFSLHRDFSIGLLAGTSLSFRFAQLDTVLALFAPALRQPVELLWTTARSAQTAARLLVFAGALVLLIAPKLAIWRRAPSEHLLRIRPIQLGAVLVLPALIGLAAAVGVFVLSRHAVAREYGFNDAQRIALTPEQPSFTQALPPLTATLTGLLLTVLPSESSALPSELQACVVLQSVEHCAQGMPLPGGYGFRLPVKVVLQSEPIRVVFRLFEPAIGARVAVPVASLPAARRPQDFQLTQGQTTLTGHTARITLLRSFDLGQALAETTERLTRDWRLFVVWPLVAIVCMIVVWRIARGVHRQEVFMKHTSRKPVG